MKTIGTQTIYDNVRFAKSIGTTNPQGTLNINSGDITLYDATNNGNPTISLGSSATERLEIKATYESGAQGLDAVEFITYTAGSSANDGRFIFKVDEVNTFQIKDSLVNIMESGKLTIGNVDILTDSSGTTTLNNIDALDATTISTISSAGFGTGDITSVGSGSGLTGGQLAGDVTLSVGAGDGITVNTNDVAVTATQTTITGIYNAGLKVGRDADNLIDFATTDNKIFFRANGVDQIVLEDGALTPRTTNDIDLGSSSFEFKDAYFDGTVTSDAFAGPLTGNVIGNCSGTAATVTSNTQAAIETCANLGTVGTITTGVWQGTAIASAYLDADTAHYSATRQVTHHGISSDIDGNVVYLSLLESDAENTGGANKHLPIIAPAAGKLLKIFVRTTVDQSSETFTWKLHTRSTSQSTNGVPSEIGAQSGAGPTNKTMVTYDFTTGLDSGTNVISAGDKVQISLEAGDGATATSVYFISCLWEWDLS